MPVNKIYCAYLTHFTIFMKNFLFVVGMCDGGSLPSTVSSQERVPTLTSSLSILPRTFPEEVK